MDLLSQLVKLGPALFLVMELLEPLLLSFVVKDRFNDKKLMFFEPFKNEFDFIIVGAGSAGCQLATRLSEKHSVLLLEAGGNPSPLLSIPVWGYLLNNQKPVDFAHRTVPQRDAAWGLNNHVSHWPAGRQLGGSSTINGLIYIRGNVQGFDKVAQRVGDGKWSMENVLKYYKKLEDYDGWFDDDAHGKGGGMSIEKAFTMLFTPYLLRGGQELGYQYRDPNFNGPYTEGFSLMDFHTKNGRRSDAFTGYLKKEMNNHPKLVIRKFAYVTKLLMDGNFVSGVRYERHGQMFQAFAKKEVILSAGSIKTPQILMLSGIGPKDHLEELGIEVKKDLPIGQNLQDKYGVLMGPFIVKDGYSFIREREITMKTILEWFTTGTGPLSAGRTEGTHAIQTNLSKSRGESVTVDGPDIHTYVISSSTDQRTELDFGKSFNFNHKSLQYFGKARGKDSFLQLVTISRPRGTGTLRLRDKNPFSSLLIDPKYLKNDEDVMALLEGMKFAVKLVEETESMKLINGHLMKIPYPGCESYAFKSDEYYVCLMRHATITAYKYCGTVPMGREDEPDAVVDNRLRVFGIKNLRVVDASILQLKYTSENDATVRMLGQLASDIILNDWAYKNSVFTDPDDYDRKNFLYK